MKEPLLGTRLDIWLWAARFYRTRALAKRAIEGGKVELNGQDGKPAKVVRVGDRVRALRGEERIECLVLGLSSVRGPASIAQSLWAETEASRLTRERAADERGLLRLGDARPPTRPGKKARRLILGFKSSIRDSGNDGGGR